MGLYQLEAIRSQTDVGTIEHQPEMKSTNDRALEMLRGERSVAQVTDGKSVFFPPLPLLVLTDKQWGGRGQRDRNWISQTGDLAMTLCLPCSNPLAPASLPLIVGLGVCQAIETTLNLNSLELKWPNDLMVGQRKLGGILVESIWLPQNDFDPASEKSQTDDRSYQRETQADTASPTRVSVIGIGVNVKFDVGKDVGLLSNPTISLSELILDSNSNQIDKTALVIAISNQLLEMLADEKKQPFESSDTMLQSIERRMNLPREGIEIELPTGEIISGRCLGLGSQQELVIETEFGPRRIASGSLRRW